MLDESAEVRIAEGGVLYRSDGTVVTRARPGDTGQAVIVKRALRDEATRRLRHEMAILERLADVPGVVRVARSRSLERSADAVLILHDDEGQPLAQRLRQGPLGVHEVMRLALKLAQAVASLHEAGVVHKDLSPHNILVVGDEPRVVLIDFGHASTTAEEHPGFEHHSLLSGTLEYMSPEQTGRTGRATDSRSDLYSLGVVLYELATGQRPFDNDDPLELIHDHLVRLPVAPVVVNERLPPGLSEVILKLLHKDPDSRYQSASGLVHDLGLLLGDSANTPLELGSHDFPARLPAPSRLAGRERELGSLRQAMTQAGAGTCRAVLISGLPGVGKTALIGELRSIVGAHRGWFVSCKFDQHAQDTLAAQQTLRALGRLILAEPEQRLAQQRERLLQHLGSNVGFGPALLPEFALLLGEHPPVVTDPRNADARQLQATLDLLRGIASPERPVLQVFDDLQWAPNTVLRLLDAVVSAYEPIAGLLVVATCRSNEVDAAHPLSAMLARWQERGIAPAAIALDNLPPADLNVMTAQMLRMPAEAAEDLTRTLAQRTEGNPFDTIELINVLRQDGLLTRHQGQWQWDAQAISHHVGNSDVVQLLQRRIHKLPERGRPLLNMLACLGGQVDLRVLQHLSGLDAEALSAGLWPALQDGLLVLESSEYTELRFKHDRVQQAVLQSMGEVSAAQLHLQLARGLAGTAAWDLLAAEQYLLAVDAGEPLRDDAERRRVIGLWQPAAERAEAANLAVAAQMLTAAIELANQTCDMAPAQTQQLDIALHRVRYGQSEFELADEVYARIVSRDPDPVTMARPACVQICGLGKRSRYDEAVEVGMALLARLGLSMPDRPDEAIVEIKARLMRWIESDDRLADLTRPLLADPRLLACASLIGQTCYAATAILGRKLPVMKWLTLQATQLWIAHGPSDELANGGVSVAAAILGQETGKMDFLRHVLAVAEQRGLKAAIPEMRLRLIAVGGHLEAPIEEQVPIWRQLREDLRRLGNYSAAGGTSLSVICLIDCAETLEAPESENNLCTSTIASLASHSYLAICRLRQLFLAALRGERNHFERADIDGVVVASIDSDLIYRYNYYSLRTIFAFIFADKAWLHGNAESAAAPHLLSVMYAATITRALVAVWRAERVREFSGVERAEWLEGMGREDWEWLSGLAAQAPANYLHLRHWLQAERAWTAGDFWLACQAFDRAMLSAAHNHRPWHRALIIERAGRFLLEQGLEHGGQRLIKLACDGYDAWGAAGKVRAMHQEFAFLAQPRSALALTRHGHSGTLSAESVDLMAVLRASQALSSETSVPALAERLTQVLSALTGATCVQLLLRSEDEGWRAGVGERLDALPWSMLRYVERTRQTLVLDDAKQDDRFALDPYLVELAQCSVMILPIVSQGELKALLQLVNTQSRNAFNAQRLDAVALICGQLAVSLDNALLYRSLEHKVTERTAALADVNRRLEQLLKLREGELRTASALKSAIVDNALVAIVTTNAAGAIVDFNPAGEQMFGLARSQVMGRAYDSLFPEHLRQLRRELIAELGHRSAERQGVRRTTQALRPDGTEFPVEVVLWRTDVDEAQYYTFSIRDITEQQRSQELIERQRNELRQSEKLTLMGSLLAGVAHELNNPLTVVVGGATLLQEKCPDTQLRGEANRVIEAAQRCARIVRTFLNMARQRQPVCGEVKLNELVLGAADMMGYALRTRGVRVQLQLADDLPVIQGDSDQLGQVILNLMVNAQQAMVAAPEPRRLVLQTGWTPSHPTQPARLWLRVHDCGPGVPQALQEKIFAPFFTTKAEGLGTGLGLAMCRAIAREHQGDVVLEPSTAGASFMLWLPLQTATALPRPEAPQPSTDVAWRSAHRAPAVPKILVVDDETELAEVLHSALQAAGFDVTLARSGAMALEQLQRHTFDAIVCDLHMPDLSGDMLWRQLQTHHPHLATRVLFITGDSFSLHVSQFLTESGRPVLYKPFSSSTLISSLRSLIGTNSALSVPSAAQSSSRRAGALWRTKGNRLASRR